MLLTNLTEVNPEEAQETLEALGGFFHNLNLRTLLTIGLLIVACLVVMKIVLRLLDRTFRRLELERGLCTFLHAALRVVLWLVTVCIVLGYIGVPMTSLVALVGVIGLAVSLAIQGTLEVGLAYTKLATVDNKVISVPNGQISGEKIINYTTADQRRVDLTFNASYDDPPQKVIEAIRQVVGAHPRALFTPEPFIRVNAYKDSSVEYVVRVWCATADYWPLYHDLLEQVKEAFDKNGIQMPYNHLNVHVVERKEEKG